jgi:hypothetical protein
MHLGRLFDKLQAALQKLFILPEEDKEAELQAALALTTAGAAGDELRPAGRVRMGS